MREIDRLTVEQFETPSLLLMEAAANAALPSITRHFSHDLSDKKALVLCGLGNNGGDGAALARALWKAGASTNVVLFGHIEQTTGDANTNLSAVRRLASFEAGSPTAPASLSLVECERVSA